MNVGDWLRGVGLGQYEATFRNNEIDADILPELTEGDLEKLGLPMGHRKRLLKAIASLGDSSRAAEPPRPSASGPAAVQPRVEDAAERRQLTVMFCDLVGSTALSARLDPEDLRGIIRSYHRCCADVVERNGGFVAKYMGDGVLAYFGYPRAHEHDAERAVRCGLALVEAVPELETAAGVPLRVRVGIATGLVVVGDLIGAGAAQEQTVVGETPNLAARLQAIAEPNMVVIAEGTRRLLGNLFDLRDLGARDLKGIAGPARTWAALRPSAIASRFEALHAAGLTALVGRDEESELLLRRWSRAKTGEGQVVLLSGEAGIGKSRLTVALLERLGGEAHTRLRYFCSSQHTDSALYPVIGQMERAAGLVHDDEPRKKLDKLDAALAPGSTPLEEAALFAEMLSLANDGRYPALELAPQQRRQRTLEALLAQLEALAHQNPVLMIFEDAHWADPTSLELFGRVVDRIAQLRVLLIVTFRPEFDPPWVGRPHVTMLTINRLAPRDIGAMIDRVAGNKALPADIRQDILERTDGIPLFVEEMTKAVLEAESEGEAERTAASVPATALSVPASLHASLMARLDRLGSAKEVAQIGAAIGREFPHTLLASVVGRSEPELRSALDRLLEAGLLFRQGVPPHASYLFKHALVQDAAYGTLLREPRRALHARIAEALESQSREAAEAEPEILAQHFRRADLAERACHYFERAGDRAAARSAYAEAIAHFAASLAQAERLAPGPERSRRELAILLKQGPAVLVFMGLRNSEVEEIYRRAYEIASTSDDARARFKALWGLWFCANLGRRTEAARDRAEELVALGERSGDEELLLEAIHCRWSTAFFRGDVARAIADSREGIKNYDPERHSALGAEFGGHDPGVCANAVAGLALAQFGSPGAAAASAERSLALSQMLNQPSSLAFAIMNAMMTYQMIGDRDAVLRLSARMLEIADKFNLPPQRSIATFLSGWANACGGSLKEGLEAMESELTRVSVMGPLPQYYAGLLASVRLESGQPAQALELLDSVLNTMKEPGVGFYLPEIHRLRGECLLRAAPVHLDEAVQAFETAVATGRRQQARAFELSAATGLLQAWAGTGRPEKGMGPLRQAVVMFGEDDEAPQLATARQILSAHSR